MAGNDSKTQGRWAGVLAGIILLLVGAERCQCQSSGLPPLAELKAAAERGDAIAQDKLGSYYHYQRSDLQNAFVWYEKAAQHGIANSQYEVASRLLQRSEEPREKANASKLADEAIRWLWLAALRGHTQSQHSIGRQYESGKWLPRDYPEAYKWYTITIHNGNDIPGKISRDRIILLMTQEQIKEGERRAKKFIATKGAGEEPPEPSFAKHLRFSGISGKEGNFLAVINGQTFAAGEVASVRINGRAVRIHCLEIRKDAVIVKVEGLGNNRELRLQ